MNRKQTIENIKPADYSAVAQTYSRVFAGEPWKEVSRCAECGSFSASSPRENAQCTCGGKFSAEAYPLAETTQYVGQEVSKPDAVGLLIAQMNVLRSSAKVANGFGWGFRLTPQELAQKKYRTQEMQALVNDLLVKTGFFYYVSEVGVVPELQGRGFGKQLTKQVVSKATQKGYKQFVVRTNEDSGMRYILENMGMQPVIGLNTGIQDTENEARVLFVGQR